MTYSYRIYDRAALCPTSDWTQLCADENANIFMNPEFLSVVEKSFAKESRLWHVVFYDEQEAPLACTSLSTFDVDLVTLAGLSVKKVVQFSRHFFPALAKLRMLLCGLPVSLGQHHLVMRREADQKLILLMLDRIMTDIARQENAKVIAFKEFTSAGCDRIMSLLSSGYQQAESPAAYMFRADFKNFSDYCAALNSHYRSDIRRSQKKFERANLAAIHLRDPGKILQLYNEQLHHLYIAVVNKSPVKLEILPASFFHNLVEQFPGQVSLTAILKNNHVIAFNWGFHDKAMFYFLFCGIDYAEQSEIDLYFNLMYHQFDYALQAGPQWISFGQTADFFKSRLGCQPQPLYFFVKGVGPTLSWIVKSFSPLLFSKRPLVPQYSIFKANRE